MNILNGTPALERVILYTSFLYAKLCTPAFRRVTFYMTLP